MATRLPQSSSNPIAPVILYMNDLRTIVEVLRTTGFPIRITAEKDGSIYEFADLAELESMAARTSYVNIDCENQGIFIWLEPDIVSVETKNDDSKTLGLSTKIVSLLTRCRRPLSVLRLPTTGGKVLTTAALLLLSGIALLPYFPPIGRKLAGGGLILTLMWTGYDLWIATKRQAVIILKERSLAPTFWDRNWEKVVVAVITACLTAFAIFIATSLKDTIAHKSGSVERADPTK